MSIPDEWLMAFADGELDDATRRQVEAALQQDPALAERVARHVALRRRLQTAYAPQLSEPMPRRLVDAAKRVPAPSGNIVDLRAARAASRPRNRVVGWRPVGALAASLVIGFGLGYASRWQRQAEPPLAQAADGAISARGALAIALSSQLAATQSPASEVHIGVSFLAKNGEYCRTFTLAGTISPSGLACRQGAQWRVDSLGQSSDASGSDYRTAGTALSPQILHAVEDHIDGQTLDAAGEAEALRKGWRQ